MLIRDLIEQNHIAWNADGTLSSTLEFNDECDKEFFLLYDEEQRFLKTVSGEIRSVLKTEGAIAADQKYHTLFFQPYLSQTQIIYSKECESRQQALRECLDLIRQKTAPVVQEYFIKENKSGLFSKKTYTGSVSYQQTRFFGYEETAKEIAIAFLYCKEPDAEKAYTYLKQCDQNDPEVMLLLSTNPCVPEDKQARYKESAAVIYQKGAAVGDMKASGKYALLILPEKPEAAFRFAERASAAEQAEGCYVMGLCYEQGFGSVSRDLLKAAAFYQTAADKGFEPAQYALAKILESEEYQDPDGGEKAFAYYLKSADQGNKESQYRTGTAYAGGTYVVPDAGKAFSYFKLAADKGHTKAQAAVGKCFAEGKGTVKSLEQAFSYFKKAADQGNADACLEVGKILAEPIGKKADIAEAFRYYKTAADMGNAEAQYQTAVFLIEGRGTAKNPETGREYLKQAAQNGNQKALRKLVDLTDSHSAGYLDQLAKEGNPSALTRRGLDYLSGKYGEADPKKAFACFLEASDMGFKEARYRVGLCYKKGIGTAADASAALHYFRLAAEQGHLNAYKEAEEMAEKIKELEESGRIGSEITILGREKQFKKAFSLIREYGEILQGRESVRTVLRDYLEYVTAERISEGFMESLASCDTLPEGLQTGEVFYDLALSYEEEGNIESAITAYYHAAKQDSLKALKTLQNMAVKKSRYFIRIDESYLG